MGMLPAKPIRLRLLLVVMMVLAGASTSLYLGSLVAPQWLVATNVPLAAMPYHVGAANDTQIAVNYFIASSTVCRDGVCASKGDRYGTESTCGRGNDQIRARYIVVTIFTTIATVCAFVSIVALGSRAFSRDPTGLSPLADDARHPTMDTEPTAGEDVHGGAGMRGFDTTGMSFQAEEMAQAPQVTVLPLAIYREKLMEARSSRKRSARRNTVVISVTVIVSLLFGMIAFAVAFGTQEGWLGCGPRSAAAHADSVRAFIAAHPELAGLRWSVQRGSSMWVLLSAFIINLVTLALVPVALLAAAGAAADELEETVSTGASPRHASTGATSPHNDTDSMGEQEPAFIRRDPSRVLVEAARSPPAASNTIPHDQMMHLESPTEIDVATKR
jgi:hypothetical protein